MFQTETDIKIDPEILSLIKKEEQRVTILHCFSPCSEETLYRIWETTYLIEDTGRKAKLLHAFNISYAPYWTIKQCTNGYASFTLVFEGLSKSYAVFKMEEQIPEPGGFYTDQITRNQTDIYKEEVFFDS